MMKLRKLPMDFNKKLKDMLEEVISDLLIRNAKTEKNYLDFN